MITLTFEQKKSLGFQFILDALSPNCVYGQELVKQAAPFLVAERKELQEELNRLQALTEHYESCRALLDKISLVLMNLKEIRGSLKRGGDSILIDIELFELKNFLLQTAKLRKLYAELSSQITLPGIAFEDTEAALNILDPEHRRIPGFYLVDAYSPELGKIREQKKHLEVVLRQQHSEEKKNQLLALRKEQVIREEEEQQRIREEITVKLRPHFEAMMTNTKMAGMLDFLIQKASIAIRYHGICPKITTDTLEINEMTNPMILDGLKQRGKTFAPVSFAMEKGTAVVTGANMGGKSVALRSIALNIILAQSGFYVYAVKAKVPMYDAVFLVAEEFQSVQNGLSSFGGEIFELQKAIQQLEHGFSFLLFDELARGTNPDEGAAIVKAVVKFLNHQNVMAVIATHYDHVAEYAGSHYQVIGLKNADMKLLEADISAADAKLGIDIIGRYMDYGIYPVQGKADCPRDAVHICGLLGLDQRIMDMME